MPLGVSVSNSEPVYLTDQLGNVLVRVQGPNGDYGLPVVIAGIEDIVLDPVTDKLSSLVTALTAPLTVGGRTTSVSVAMPVTGSGAYVSGDFVGTYTQPVALAGLGRAGIGSGVILTALLLDKAVQSASMELWLFNARAIVMPADNAAWTITDTELQSVVGVIAIGTYNASALNSIATAPNIGLAYRTLGNDTNLYAALVTRGTPTYTSTSDLTLTVVASLD